jgi:hypothetical protein
VTGPLYIPSALRPLADRAARGIPEARAVLEDWIREQGGEGVDAWLARGPWYLFSHMRGVALEVVVMEGNAFSSLVMRRDGTFAMFGEGTLYVFEPAPVAPALEVSPSWPHGE